jgi:iron complex outermembrane recepter protein
LFAVEYVTVISHIRNSLAPSRLRACTAPSLSTTKSWLLDTALPIGGGLMVIVAASLPARGQQASPSAPLPPVVVQPGQTVTRPAEQPESKPPRSARRHAKRTPQQNPNPAPPAPADNGVSQSLLRDGIEGYFAQTTTAGAKEATPILKLPRSVSTVTQQEMTDREVQSVREALQYTAGVNPYYEEGQFTRDFARIRGFAALQFLDGLRLNANNYGIEPYGLERIDVLKGPASTLYGQGSPGGLWDMTSKRPTDYSFGEALVRFGSYGVVQGAFDVGGPVTPDHSLLYRVVGLGTLGDGQIDFTKDEREFFAPSFTWRPNEDTSFTLLAAHQYDPYVTVLQPLPYVGTIVPGANGQFISRNLFLGEPDYHNTSVEQDRIGYELKHQMNDVFSFQQNVYYQSIDIKLNEVQSSASASNTTTARTANHQTFQIEMYQIDNRLMANFNMGPLQHHMLFGFDYSAVPNVQGTGTAAKTTQPASLNFYNPVYSLPFQTNIPITSYRYQDLRQAGSYAQDRVELGGLSVLLGARYDQVETDQKTRVVTAAGFTNPAWILQPDHAPTYNAGAIYEFKNGLAPYVSWSQTFTPQFGTDFFGNPFIPVTGEQKEAGIKYLPPGLHVLMTAAVFDIVQYNVLTPDLVHKALGNFSVQTSSVEAQGAEIELKTTNLYGLNLSAAYTYLDDKVIATNTAGVLGKHPVGIPMNQASLWTTYRFENGPAEGFTIGGGVRYVGDQAVDAANTLPVPAFVLYDMLVRYELGAISPQLKNWDVALNIKNLMDTRYVGSCDDAFDCYYGPGRNVTGTIRARW